MTDRRPAAARSTTPRPPARPDAPAPTRELAADPGPVPTPAARRPRTCNLLPCPEAPEWAGLCSAHRQTHRGLADPKGTR